MTDAADALARTILESGARRVAFLGLAKNVGKTTALVAALEAIHRRGVVAGTTSAGRDGEAWDAITGEPKPRFRVWPEQLVASAASTFEAASFPSTEIASPGFATRFGPITVRRARASGEIEIIGPSTVSQMRTTAESLEAAGARIVLLDGAVGRRAFAGGRVADGIVLCVGMAAGSSLDVVMASARAALNLIRLPRAGSAGAQSIRDGALTDSSLRERPPRAGETLVVRDFTAMFLSSESLVGLSAAGVALAVREPARLLAVTSNPTAPARPPLPAARVFEALRAEASVAPVFDLVADLQSDR